MGKDEQTAPAVPGDAEVCASASESLPVVARLVVEIRSDGRTTIARGALEDRVTGQQVVVRAQGDSPLSLAMALVRSLIRVPALARRTPDPSLPAQKPSVRRALRGALAARRRRRP